MPQGRLSRNWFSLTSTHLRKSSWLVSLQMRFKTLHLILFKLEIILILSTIFACISYKTDFKNNRNLLIFFKPFYYKSLQTNFIIIWLIWICEYSKSKDLLIFKQICKNSNF